MASLNRQIIPEPPMETPKFDEELKASKKATQFYPYDEQQHQLQPTKIGSVLLP